MKTYDEMVHRSILRALADEEGRLLASAMMWEISATRMSSELEAALEASPHLSKEQVREIEQEIAQLGARAKAARADASAVQGRATGTSTKVVPPPKKKFKLEDVIFTFEGEVLKKAPALIHSSNFVQALHNLKHGTTDSLTSARYLFDHISWPDDSGPFAQAALEQLDRIIKERSLVLP